MDAIALLAVATEDRFRKHGMVVIAFIYVCASLAAVAAFAWDKRAARVGRRRIAEGRLHLLELLGGWPGALLAIQTIRHKSSKPRYYLVTWAITVLHAAGWVAWFMFWRAAR
jgi:uncharacterized membrane protein YsdA (DUF1294 family)